MVNCSGTRSSNSSRSLDKWYESILKNQIKKFLNTLLVLQSNALKLKYPKGKLLSWTLFIYLESLCKIFK